MLILQQMIILFLLMLTGFACRKTGILNSEGTRVISGLVVNVANPALILSASMGSEGTVSGYELLYTALLALGVYVFLMIMAFLVPFLLRIKPECIGTYRVMTVFSNIGFMGFPVISAVYGTDALLYASVFLLPYNLLIYTWGIRVMAGSSDAGAKAADHHKMPIKSRLRKLAGIFNIGVISCILTMIIYLSGIKMPVYIESTVEKLSGLTAPLSMMVIGASMVDMKFGELLRDVRLLFFSVIKLVIIPVAGVLIIKQFGMNPMLCGVCMIMLSTPVGSMTAMLASQYGGDYGLASRGVALTTILSVATIPLVSYITGV